MTERSVNEITSDTEDVSYEIKRARIGTSSPVDDNPANRSMDSAKASVYSNGNSADTESTSPFTLLGFAFEMAIFGKLPLLLLMSNKRVKSNRRIVA